MEFKLTKEEAAFLYVVLNEVRFGRGAAVSRWAARARDDTWALRAGEEAAVPPRRFRWLQVYKRLFNWSADSPNLERALFDGGSRELHERILTELRRA